MRTKNPRCAYCGDVIGSKNYIMFEFTQHPGNPKIGWHAKPNCKKDQTLHLLLSVETSHGYDNVFIRSVLDEIQKRGPNRILWRNP